MSMFASTKRALRLVIVATTVLLGPAGFAQGCAMCKANAAATDAKSQRAINFAILVMVLPSACIMLVGGAFAYRYSRKRDSD